MKKEVILYQKADGTYPVQDFLDSFPAKVSKKITWVTSLVEDLEHVPALYFSKLSDTDDVWEFRIKLGSNIYRVFALKNPKRRRPVRSNGQRIIKKTTLTVKK